MLPSVIGVVLGSVLRVSNPTLPSTIAVTTAVDKSPATARLVTGRGGRRLTHSSYTTTGDTTRECPNRLVARVISSVYLGSVSRRRLLVGSDEIVMHDHAAGAALVPNGSEVQITIDPKKARVLRER
ncbi:MAG: TOBE domain-containing protein [Bradyrhizobium sp.]|uniref:TOBE domain-containing protein n=1 Tax=Bradyrhizobium sp. TaxID=376 RepID=UPI001D77F956|nr:TOBE domain-containing protein [Bradyrhizobium sp.]